LVNDDALTVEFDELLKGKAVAGKAKLVANLPYNISTPILQRLIEHRALFSEIVLMFQREVVERITAKPGGKERGFLSVLVESAFETEYLFDVPPAAFYPVPKVWSAVVRLTPKEMQVEDEKAFRKLVSAAFVQKRKTILNNLRHNYERAEDLLQEAGIDVKRRAETLTLDEWIRLANLIAKN
jgi:16S rRNA (adenine1518-N6/adenine1519-N6)-dimethyltransferase